MTRKNNSETKSRNEKFIEMYKHRMQTEEFNAIHAHKKVRYLHDEFLKEYNVKIPIGVIYKLIKTVENQPEIPSKPTPGVIDSPSTAVI